MKISDFSKYTENTKTILEELVSSSISSKQLQTRSSHALQAVINLFESIDHYFSVEDSEYLKKKFLLTIKTKNANKFIKLIESMSGKTCE